MSQLCPIPCLDWKRVCFPKGNTIFLQGTLSDCLYFLCQGSVKLSRSTTFGKERIVSIVTPGHIFGFDCLHNGSTRAFSAVAREHICVRQCSSARLIPSLKSNNDLMLRILLSLSDSLENALLEKLLLSASRSSERLSRVLLHFADHGSNSGGIAELKQKEVAELLGISPETVCRELRRIRTRSPRSHF